MMLSDELDSCFDSFIDPWIALYQCTLRMNSLLTALSSSPEPPNCSFSYSGGASLCPGSTIATSVTKHNSVKEMKSTERGVWEADAE